MAAGRGLLLCAVLTSSLFPRSLCGQRGSPRDSLVPEFAWTTDSVTALAGLPTLRGTAFAPGIRREIRMWVGFGRLMPNLLLRVADSSGSVVGLGVAWWPGGPEPEGRFVGTPAQEAAYKQEWLRNTQKIREYVLRSYQCSALRRGSHTEVCFIQAEGSHEFVTLLTQIDSLDAWHLRDPSELTPPGTIGLDGTTLMVEVRTASGYRTYSYWEPGDGPWPEAKRAGSLARLVFGAFPRRE